MGDKTKSPQNATSPEWVGTRHQPLQLEGNPKFEQFRIDITLAIEPINALNLFVHVGEITAHGQAGAPIESAAGKITIANAETGAEFVQCKLFSAGANIQKGNLIGVFAAVQILVTHAGAQIKAALMPA